MARHVFDDRRQAWFARLSGDVNPMHMDPIFARRTQMGSPVVHGIHTLLWALDAALAQGGAGFAVRSLKARFSQPLFVGDTAELALQQSGEGKLRLDVLCGAAVVISATLAGQSGRYDGGRALALRHPPQRPAAPIDLDFSALAGQQGTLDAATDETETARAFPYLCAAIGVDAVAGLVESSFLVGMVCPGLHSMFAGLEVRFVPAADGPLRFDVVKADARFRSLQIDVAGRGIAGRLDVFARVPPPRQKDMAELARHVTDGEFRGQTALIVGGSRGLGEATARIVAAGGGHPIITWRNAPQEAEALAQDIRAAGATCEVLAYDALAPAAAQLGDLAPTHCYYFATPRIAQRKDGFDPKLFAQFTRYYVDGFFDLCAVLAARGTAAALYPSSVFVEERPAGFAEYVMSKAAGELLCGYMSEMLPGLRVEMHRLPRVLTDQTAAIGVFNLADAAEIMLPLVRAMQAAP